MKQALAGFELLVIDHTQRSRRTRRQLQDWEVEVLPTLIFAAPSGEVTRVLTGVPTAEELRAAARSTTGR